MNRHISYMDTMNLVRFGYYHSVVNKIIFSDKIIIILSPLNCFTKNLVLKGKCSVNVFLFNKF